MNLGIVNLGIVNLGIANIGITHTKTVTATTDSPHSHRNHRATHPTNYR